jgi:enoyl-CoA hydratase/carnithine racemase
MTNALTLTIEKNGVANLVFDLPNEKVNKLSAPVLEELEKALNVIDGNKAIRILLITSHKQNIFQFQVYNPQVV